MTDWNKSRWVVCAIVVTTIYFSAALALRHSYALRVPPGEILRLTHPFERFEIVGLAYIAKAPMLDGLADSPDDPARSPVMLYEDNHPLGPAHSVHADIAESGDGQFSHWKSVGFIFSSSDGTDPNVNGRNYWVVPSSRP
jgi:hypothetical protein